MIIRSLALICLCLVSSLGTISAVEPMLSSGRDHTLFLAEDGTVWAWGDNTYGQLGDGTTDPSSDPVQVVGLTNVKQVAAGYWFSMALTNDGQVYAWGRNNYGALGDGTTDSDPHENPVLVPIADPIIQIAAASFHSLAIKDDNEAVAWGWNREGGLGLGFETVVSPFAEATPTDLPSGIKWRQLAGGGQHSIGLDTQGRVWTWGLNTNGQLGDNTIVDKSTPTQVFYDALKTNAVIARDIAAGYFHSLILRADDDQAYAWGLNDSGQLNVNPGLLGQSSLPLSFGGIFANGVGAGYKHSWITRTNGFKTWYGDNSFGQLGADPAGTVFSSTGTTSSFNFRMGATGPSANHTMMMNGEGFITGWGNNSFGQLGNGDDTSTHLLQTACARWPMKRIIAVSQGDKHTVGLGSDGRVWSWGDTGDGQGGNGVTSGINTLPVEADGISNAIQVSAGGNFTLALTNRGQLYAWGDNSKGQFGDTTTISSDVPKLVPTGLSILKVEAGQLHSLLLTSEGRVYATGLDNEGQLGNDAALANKTSFTLIPTLSEIIDISAGDNHNLALDSSGVVWVWGRGDEGQTALGTGPGFDLAQPSNHLGGILLKIAAGGNHNLVTVSGSATPWTWGAGTAGQLGRNVIADDQNPAECEDSGGSIFTGIIDIAVGTDHTLFMDASGQLYSAGHNSQGELGIGSTTLTDHFSSVPGMDDTFAFAAGASTSVVANYDGKVLGSGDNDVGQIGNNTKIDSDRFTETSENWLPTINVSLGSSDLTATEAGETNGFIAVNHNGSLAGAIDFNFAISGTATSGSDYDAIGSSLKILGCFSTGYIFVSPEDDDFDDDNETVIATLSSSSEYQLGTTLSGTVTITDNDEAGIKVSPTVGLITTEAGGTDSFQVFLETEPTAPVNINLTSSNPNEGTVTSSIQLTAANWDTGVLVTVTGVNDDVDDGDEAYTIVTAAATSTDLNYNGLNAADVSVTNTDNDDADIIVSPTTGLTTTEAGGTDTFDIRLDSEPTAPVTINLSSSNVNEGAVSPTSVTFDADDWNIDQEVTVTGVDDDVDDGDQGYSIITAAATSADANYNGFDADNVSVTNSDDDTAGIIINGTASTADDTAAVTEGIVDDTYTIRLTSEPTGTVTINITNSGQVTTSPTSIEFDAGNWDNPVEVTVSGIIDGDVEGNHGDTIVNDPSGADYGTVADANVTVDITDNDTKGVLVTPTSRVITEGQSANFSVVLTAKPESNQLTPLGVARVRVDIDASTTAGASDAATFSPDPDVKSVFFSHTATGDGSGDDTSNFRAWNNPKIISVTAGNNATDDGSSIFETLVITTVDGSTNDSAYDAVDPDDVSIENVDNNVEGTTIDLVDGSVEVTEGGATDTYRIRLNTDPSGLVAMSLATTSSDFTIDKPTIFFDGTNFATFQTITLTAIDDDLDETSPETTSLAEAITHTVSASTSGIYTVGETYSTVLVDIIDDDTAGITVTPTSGLNTTEAGGIATFNVTLDSEPTDDVEITLQSNAIGEARLEAGGAARTLFFGAAGSGDFSGDDASNLRPWNSALTVDVTGQDDSVEDGDQGFTISMTGITSTDGNYSTASFASVTGFNLDDDTVGLTLTESAGSTTVTEGGATDNYTAALDSEPTGTVTVTVSTGSEVSATPTVISFGPSATGDGSGSDGSNLRLWSNAATITVTAVDDNVAESSPHAGAISHSIVGADYTGLTISDISVDVTDNDNAGYEIVDATGSPIGAPIQVLESLGGGQTLLTSTGTTGATGVITFADSDDLSAAFVGQLVLFGSGTNDGIQGTIQTIDNIAPGKSITIETGLASDAGSELILLPGGFRIRLASQPLANVEVGFVTDDESEGFSTPPQVTFTPTNWMDYQTITVIGENDDIDDGDISFNITGNPSSSLDPTYDGTSPATVAATNIDDDAAGVTITPLLLVTSEGGLASSFSAVLNSEPEATITIGLTSNDTDQATVDVSSVTFTTSDWNQAQTVTVTGADGDSIDQGTDLISTGTTGATGVMQFAGGTDLSSVSINDYAVIYGTDANDGVFSLITAVDDGADTVTVTAADVADAGAEGVTFITPTTIVTATPTADGAGDANYTALSPADVSVVNLPINNEPDIDTPPTETVNEDASTTTVNLTGIGPGQTGEESQTLAVTAVSSNPALIPDPIITYSSPNSIGTLDYTPVPNQSGSATITVTVTDNGGTDLGGDDTIEVSFVINVTAVNDPPTVDIDGDTIPENGYNTAFTEGAGAVAAVNATGLLLNDLDNANASSATATLSPIPDGSNESLAVNVGATGITDNYNSVTGVLTLTTPTPLPLSDWQDVLRTLEYNNTSGEPDEANRSISIVLNDGTDNSAADVTTLMVSDVLFNPTVDIDGDGIPYNSYFVNYTEGDGAISIVDAGMLINDSDSLNLTGATVSITNLQDAGEELLSVVTGASGITASYTAPTLTLSTTAPIADYQAVLRTLAYTNSSEDPNTMNRNVDITVTDTTGQVSGIDFVQIQVNAINDAPIITVNSGITLGIGDTLLLDQTNLDATDIDNALTDLFFEILIDTSQGNLEKDSGGGFVDMNVSDTFTLSDLASGNIRYTHTSATAADDAFAVQVSDSTDSSALEVFSITVTGLAPPDITFTDTSDLAYTENDPAISIESSATVTDVDSTDFNGGNLTVSITNAESEDSLLVGTGLGISIVDDGGSFSLYFGGSLDAFGTISDTFGSNGSGGGDLVISLTSFAGITEAQSLVRSIQFEHLGDNPTLLAKTVNMVLNDGSIDSTVESRTINVTPENDAPSVTSATLVAIPTLTRTGTIIITDPDSLAAGITETITAQPSKAPAVTIDVNDQFEYTALVGTTGTDSFDIQVTDGDGGITNYTVPIQISDSGATTLSLDNNPPFSVPQDDPLLFTPSISGQAAGATLTFELVGLDPSSFVDLNFNATDGTINWASVPAPTDDYYQFGILVTDTTNNEALYIPILLFIAPPGAGT